MVQNLAEVDEEEVETALEVYAKNEGITAFMQPQGSSYTKTLGRNLNYNQDSDQNSVIIEEREVVTRDKKRLLVQFVAHYRSGPPGHTGHTDLAAYVPRGLGGFGSDGSLCLRPQPVSASQPHGGHDRAHEAVGPDGFLCEYPPR